MYNSSNNNRLRHQAGGAGYHSGRGTPTNPYMAPSALPPQPSATDIEDDPNSKDSRLRSKISMLKDVTINIGDEIRDQNKFLASMGEDMEGMGGKLAATMKQFYRMWARQGCGPFFYLTFFAIGVVVFMYIYLKAR